MLQLADGRIGTGHDDVLGALVPSACVLVNAALLHVLTSRQAWTVLGAPDEGHQCATSSSRAASMPYRAAHTPLPARSLVSSIPETATDAWLANKLLLQVEPSCGLHAAQAATPIPTRWSSHASTNSRLCSCMLLCCCQTAPSKPWGLGTHHMHYSCHGRVVRQPGCTRHADNTCLRINTPPQPNTATQPSAMAPGPLYHAG